MSSVFGEEERHLSSSIGVVSNGKISDFTTFSVKNLQTFYAKMISYLLLSYLLHIRVCRGYRYKSRSTESVTACCTSAPSFCHAYMLCPQSR